MKLAKPFSIFQQNFQKNNPETFLFFLKVFIALVFVNDSPTFTKITTLIKVVGSTSGSENGLCVERFPSALRRTDSTTNDQFEWVG